MRRLINRLTGKGDAESPEVDVFVSMMAVLEDEPVFRQRLLEILEQPDVVRRMELGRIIDQMRAANESPELIGAFEKLLEAGVSARAVELLSGSSH